MMLAVIQTGGKQYLVQKGDKIEVEKLLSADDKEVTFEEVLLISDGKQTSTKVGSPFLKGASVKAKVLSTQKGDKVRVYKMKQRKRYRRNKGHRQMMTTVEILDIKA